MAKSFAGYKMTPMSDVAKPTKARPMRESTAAPPSALVKPRRKTAVGGQNSPTSGSGQSSTKTRTFGSLF